MSELFIPCDVCGSRPSVIQRDSKYEVWKCPRCYEDAKAALEGARMTGERPLREGEAPWDDGAMTRCTRCFKDTAVWGHDGKCPDCIAATSNFGKAEPITSHTYSGCAFCKYDDGEQTHWCVHHVRGMQETIRARDKSIAEYSTKVRVLEKSLAEWKAKAEKAQHAEDINRELYEKTERQHQEALQDGSICPAPDEHASQDAEGRRGMSDNECQAVKLAVEWFWRLYQPACDELARRDREEKGDE